MQRRPTHFCEISVMVTNGVGDALWKITEYSEEILMFPLTLLLDWNVGHGRTQQNFHRVNFGCQRLVTTYLNFQTSLVIWPHYI